ncbi:putative SCAMP family [Trypanosoma vivax]|uniref:Putative membrane-trafficking protein n=1 Tax=Trypanosoma vivax (strain Y486) TaxID=1055687 RepID=G0U2V0_TRYVY|nr:putative membrane-trafficking protein [Trypanosoma vivax]KAH8604292.1 putative SCAMP family [Trypanosoma vivax]CCC50604.1 putative membrane-trafficking protein [Trypanosoma vivax Y486]
MSEEESNGVPPDITLAMVEAKEKELAQRREELREREKNIAPELSPEPNFPPEFLCIKPLIYHNIKEHIPVPFQKFMYSLCFLYFALVALILYNILSALISVAFGGSGKHFGLSFLYLLGIPGGFIVWYYNAYIAAVDESRPRRLLACLGIAIGFLFDVWMSIGVSGCGGCGWIATFGESKRAVSFIMFLIASCLWTVHTVALAFMLVYLWRLPAKAVSPSTLIKYAL